MFSTDPVVQSRMLASSRITIPYWETFPSIFRKVNLFIMVGRTGSGKSSLLKTLYADFPLRLGEIKVAGFDIRTESKAVRVPLLRRKLGIIFQDFQLFNDRTVGENLNVCNESNRLE